MAKLLDENQQTQKEQHDWIDNTTVPTSTFSGNKPDITPPAEPPGYH